jgi:hypothetical protein
MPPQGSIGSENVRLRRNAPMGGNLRAEKAMEVIPGVSGEFRQSQLRKSPYHLSVTWRGSGGNWTGARSEHVPGVNNMSGV